MNKDMLRRIVIPKRTCVITADAIKGVTFEVGMDLYLVNQKIRLSNIKAYNVKKKDEKDIAKEGLKYLKDNVVNKQNIFLEVSGKDKFGRWLGSIIVKTQEDNTTNLNSEMLKQGVVKAFNYE